LGSPSRGSTSLFPCSSSPIFPHDLPLRSAPKLHLTHGPSSSEYLCVVVPAPLDLSIRSSPTKGLIPHRDITALRSLTQAHPSCLLCSALRLSQPLDGLLRSAAGGLIPFHRHVQGCLPFRGFSPRAAFLPSSERVASLPLSPRLLTDRNRMPHSRASASRLCSTRGSVANGSVLPSSSLAPLFGFLFPPGVSLRLAIRFPVPLHS
jgi:hypothetical protein